jgi:ElaB/YqjD/DUF883 family membrane-anchored ribosome-binding protein
MEATSNPGPGRSASGSELQNRAQETAGEVKRVAKEKASGVKAEVRERAQEVKEEVRGRVDERKQVATEKVHALARALRAAGDTLEDEGESALARYGRQAADQVERLASYIDGNDTNGMMRQFEGMARDNPAAFTGTTFAAGLLLGRFLRASRPDDGRDARDRADRETVYRGGDGMTDASAFGAGTDTGGGFGSSAETHLARDRASETGYGSERGTSRESDVASSQIGPSRVTDTGFDTRGTTFGSGIGHATTGGGSTAGRSGTGTPDDDRTEQDRQRSGSRPEGGSSNG